MPNLWKATISHMKALVQNNYVIVEPDYQPLMSGRIAKPQMAEERPTCGIVIAKGPKCRTLANKGSKVLFSSLSGTEINFGGEPKIALPEDQIKGFIYSNVHLSQTIPDGNYPEEWMDNVWPAHPGKFLFERRTISETGPDGLIFLSERYQKGVKSPICRVHLSSCLEFKRKDVLYINVGISLHMTFGYPEERRLYVGEPAHALMQYVHDGEEKWSFESAPEMEESTTFYGRPLPPGSMQDKPDQGRHVVDEVRDSVRTELG